MSSPDQLELSPGATESAADQLANDSLEATATAELMSGIGRALPAPAEGSSIATALTALGAAYSQGFTTIGTELDELSAQVIAAVQLLQLVDNNAAGYFTPSDAI